MKNVFFVKPRLLSALGLFALFCLCSAASAQTWTGTTSDLWTTGTNWTGGTAPNSSSAVVNISSTTNNPVMLGTNTSISTLAMGASTSLDITAGALSVFGTTISNAGSITLDSLLQMANNVTLSGAGTLTLVGGQIGTNGTPFTLTNQSTIAGYGTIGSNVGADYPYVSLTNSGTINANSSTNTLVIAGSGTAFTNSGTLEATSGGILDIAAPDPINNSGGKITAAGSGSTVEISTTIEGGTLRTTGASVMETIGNATLDGSTAGAITLADGSTYTGAAGTTTSVVGAFNLGTSTGSSLALAGNLRLTGNTTISGPGSITLTGGQIGTNGNQYALTNTVTIQGYGDIGSNVGSDYPYLSLANSGTINANSSGNTLEIGGSGATITNTGLFEATGGGTLLLNTGATVVNAGANITASGNGSTVSFDNVTIQGGTISGTSGTTLQTIGSTTLDASTSGAMTLTDGSTYTSGTNTTTSLVGTLNLGTSTGSTVALTGNLRLIGDATLSGPGSIILTGGQIGTNGNQFTLTNDSIIQGYGALGSNVGSDYPYLSLVNSGLINSNSSGNILTVGGSGSSLSNTGVIEATAGGTLIVSPANGLDNQNGVLKASGAGSTVEISGTTIQGGTLTTANGGAMETAGSGATLDGLTNGAITLSDGSTYTAGTAALTNIMGSLNLGTSTGSNFALTGQLRLTGNTTLSGPGTFTLTSTGGNTAQIGTNGNQYTLTNSATIQGAGLIGSDVGSLYDYLSLTNNGTVNATGGTLTITGNSTTTTNNGTMAVQSGSTLTIQDAFSNFNSTTNTLTGGTYNVDGGTLQFNGANIVTNAADIDMNGASAQIISNTNANALANFAINAAGGTFQIGGGYNFTTAGNFTNDGLLIVGAGDTFDVSGSLTNFSASTLTGGSYFVGGKLEFGASGSSITTNDANLTLSGTTWKVVNSAGANMLSALATNDSGAKLTVENGASYTDKTLTNNGTVDLENGGKLKINGSLTNSGTVTTNGTNAVGTANSLTITGKLTNKTGATVTIGDNNDTVDTASIGSFSNSGSMTVGTGAAMTLTTAATDTNTKTIAVDGALDLNNNVTLSGAGTLTLNAGTMTGLSTGLTLTNSSTIAGAGTISNLGITNSGTLLANQSSPLVILPSSAGLTNTGTLTVNSGSTMQIGTSAGGALTNFSGGTLTGGVYNVTGTLQFGASSDTIATNAANITLNGAGSMINFGNTNLLAGFNNNASSGVFKLASGAALTTSGGNFTNAGTFTISTGTTFTIGGSGFNYTQTAGSTTVAGTLTSTSLGTVDLNGGTLTGAGTIGDNLVDDSTLDPGTSAAKTGKLTVADTYTQDAGGSLNIQINGATAGTKYDQLKITGTATLGGTLNIDLGSFTPTVGQKFTILTASSVADQFATVNGLAINGSEHFTITYNAGTVVLTVVSGPLPASSTSLVTNAVHPVFYRGATIHHAAVNGGHFALAVNNLRTARTPVSGTVAAPLPSTLAPALRLAHVPAASPVLAPVTLPVTQMPVGMGRHGFHAMDDFGTPVAASSAAGDSTGVLGSMGISAVGAEAYNSMSSMNHLRFEVGIDMKALMKTSRKQLVRSLWASPDSPEALSIGYMTFTSSH